MAYNSWYGGGGDVWSTVQRRAQEEAQKGSRISPQEMSGYEQQLGMCISPEQLYAPWNVRGTATQTPVGRGLGSSTTGQGAGTPREPQRTTEDFRSMVEEQKRQQEEIARQTMEDMQRQYEEAFAPLVSGAEEQLSALPGQRGEVMGAVGRGAEARRGAVGTLRERSLRNLGEQEEKVKERGTETMRSLSEKARQGMQAAGKYLGAVGAGDSSVTGQVGSFINRSLLRQRGDVSEQVSEQVQDIESRRLDVEDMTAQKMQEIEADAAAQEQQLLMQFNEIQRGLESQKAQATAQQKIALADRQMQLQDEVRNRLNELNDQVLAQQAGIEQWNRERQAELEDFARNVSQRGTYTGGAGQEAFNKDMLKQANLRVTDLVARGMSEEEARRRAAATYNVPLQFVGYPELPEEEEGLFAEGEQASGGSYLRNLANKSSKAYQALWPF